MLHDVVRCGDKEDIATAVEVFADHINQFDEDDMTPLMLLAVRQYRQVETAHELFDLLVDYGANVDACNKKGCTALYYAVETHSHSAVVALLEHSPRIDYFVDMSYSLLHKAVLMGNASVFLALFNYCTEDVLFVRDKVTGETIFHLLVRRRHIFKEVLHHVISSPKSKNALAVCDHYKETPLLKATLQHPRSRSLITLIYTHNNMLTPVHSVQSYVYQKRLVDAQIIIKEQEN